MPILLVIGAIAVLMVVILVEAVVLLLPRGTASAAGATLSALQGQVLVQKGGQGDWVEAAQGFVIEAGDRVRTTDASHAVLTFLEGTTTELSELTELRVDKLQLTGGQSVVIKLDLDAGEIWNRIAQLPADSLHEVTTLAATVTCHGSQYGVAVNGTGTTWVRGHEGQVEVTGGGSTVAVAPGETLIVEVGFAPARYVPVVAEAPADAVSGSQGASIQGGEMPTFLNQPVPTGIPTNTPTATATSRPSPPTPTATRRPPPTPTTPVCPQNCPTFRINVPSTAPPYRLFGIEWDVLGGSVPAGYAYVLEFSQDGASWGRTPPLRWKDSQGMGELWQAGGHTNAEINGPGPGMWSWRVCLVQTETGPSCCCGPSHTIEHQRDDGC